MTQVILFAQDIPDLSLLKSSLTVPYSTVDSTVDGTVDDVDVVIDTNDPSNSTDIAIAGTDTDPMVANASGINASGINASGINASDALPLIQSMDLSNTNTVGILYENTHGLIHNLSDLVGGLVEKSSTIKMIDLLTCNLNSPSEIAEIKELEATHGVQIRYSVDLTGHEDSMGNWLLESHGVEVKDMYFNEKIDEWKHVLHTNYFNEANFLAVVATATDAAGEFTPLANGQRHGGGTWSNDQITAVTFKSNIQIGVGAFRYCNLTSITIPNSVTSIDDYAFFGNPNLTSVVIGNSVETIGRSAFRNCNLTSITIPNSVKTIGVITFTSNPNLTSVVVGNGLVGWGVDSFRDAADSLRIVSIDNTTLENVGRGSAAHDRIFLSTSTPPSATDLSGFNFSGADLSGINLSNADLTGAVLTSGGVLSTIFDSTTIMTGMIGGPLGGLQDSDPVPTIPSAAPHEWSAQHLSFFAIPDVAGQTPVFLGGQVGVNGPEIILTVDSRFVYKNEPGTYSSDFEALQNYTFSDQITADVDLSNQVVLSNNTSVNTIDDTFDVNNLNGTVFVGCVFTTGSKTTLESFNVSLLNCSFV